MADYFTQFSCALNLASAETVARALVLLDELREDATDDDPIYGFEAEVDPLRPDTLCFTDDAGNGEPEHLIRFVVACAEAFDLTGRWGFAWALTCSKARLDGFGGGAQLLDLGARKSLDWIDCDHWLAGGLDPKAEANGGLGAEEEQVTDETSIPRSVADFEDQPVASSPHAITTE